MLCKGFELAQSDKTAAVTPPEPAPTVTCICGRDIQTVVRWGVGWHGYRFAVPDHDDGKTPMWEGTPIRVLVEEDRMIRLPASVLAALGASAGDSVDFTRSGQVFYMSRSDQPPVRIADDLRPRRPEVFNRSGHGVGKVVVVR